MVEYIVLPKTFIEKERWRTTLADIYHIWADKKQGISDIDFASNMRKFLQKLVDEEKMLSYRITRCKLGFRSIQDLPEWHIMMEFTGMAQLDEAFGKVVPKQGDLEKAHVSFNRFVEDNIQHALYRDWPDVLTEKTSRSKITLDPKIEKKIKGNYTTQELVESTKNIDPSIWKN